ncbi:MAG: disulfide bond formation protein B [Paralcaligenes sp.]
MPTHFHTDPFYTSRVINTFALLAICGVLGFAFAWQLIYNEIPCPLCLLQRVAFILAGIGLLLNVRYGPANLHYGLIILSALAGAFVAACQMALHIMPGDAGYGAPFLGLHFYTWALLMFIALIAYCGLMLCLDRSNFQSTFSRSPGPYARQVMWLFFLLALANLGSTLLECGYGACVDNPIRYLWLS